MLTRQPEFITTTRDGLTVEVYRVQPTDAAYLVDLFEHLSSNSRYMRFNQYLNAVDTETVRREAENIAMLDPAKGLSFLAFVDLPDQPRAPVAGARFVRTKTPGEAEVSVSVRDDMQHRGIGGQMLLFLMEEARRAGIGVLVGTFQTGNRRIWALLGESPYQSTTVIDGFQTVVSIDLQLARRTPDEHASAASNTQQMR